MSDSEFEVDDLFEPDRKKSIKSGQKGKRVEREVCKVFISRFSKLLNENPKWGMFSRSVGSGNRWGQNVKLSQAATDTFSGDISVPANFRFVIESKGGYNDVDLCAAFEGGHTQIDDFLKQVSDDSSRCGRKPMLLWKKDRKPRLAFLHAGELPVDFENQLDYAMKYREWRVYLLEDILKLPDDFYFDVSGAGPLLV